MYCLLFRNFESPASLCSPQKRRKTTIQWWLFSVWLLFFFFSVGYTHTLKSHHCMVVVVFLLFCGLHNEAGDSKFRKGRQYIAYVGHVGGLCHNLLVYEEICKQNNSIGIISCVTETYQQLSAKKSGFISRDSTCSYKMMICSIWRLSFGCGWSGEPTGMKRWCSAAEEVCTDDIRLHAHFGMHATALFLHVC